MGKESRNLLIMKDTITNTSLRGIIVLLVIFSIWIVVSNTRNVSEMEDYNSKKIDSLTKKVDSLQQEIFVYNLNLMRYDYALDLLKEEDSSTARKFEDVLYTIE